MNPLSETETRIHSVLRSGGPMTRHELLERSGFSRETVWRVTTGLIRRGLVKQIGENTHLGCKGVRGPLFAATEERMPADALIEVIDGWVRSA